ncbi:MAG TPA: GNAT family N-acetyltransferase [Chitinophagaceae bacterium]|nr:GNAT family N-acetyltransferase [Chitinophagaceae bacterium]
MIVWQIKPFQDLTPDELYAILLLRSAIFVVEQQCVFLDMDNKDQQCLHLMGFRNDELVAYTRLVPPGVSYEYPSIGRVVTASGERGKGTGKELMKKSILEIQKLYGNTPIRIGAQVYLLNFYQGLGFQPSGEVYDEDGIDHIEMTLPPVS